MIVGAGAEHPYYGTSAGANTAMNPALAGEPYVYARASAFSEGQTGASTGTGSGILPGWGSTPGGLSLARASANGQTGVLRGTARSSTTGVWSQDPNNPGLLLYYGSAQFVSEIQDVWRLSGPGATGFLLIEVDIGYELNAGNTDGSGAMLRFQSLLRLPHELDPDGLNSPYASLGMAGLFFNEEQGMTEFNSLWNGLPGEYGRMQSSFAVPVPLNVDLNFAASIAGASIGDGSVNAENSAYIKVTPLDGLTFESLSGYNYLGRQVGAGDPGDIAAVPEPGTWPAGGLGLCIAWWVRKRRAR